MSYVRANTAPVFGMRSQALWPANQNLGTYLRASFPLPTTSMSRPINGLGLGSPFFDGPYTHYPQPQQRGSLQGDYVPPPPPARATFTQGALTYHIDPRTGQYQFYSTDILPRGLWQQNTFQHPVQPALSSLGVPMQSRGSQLVKLPNGRTIVMKTSPKHGCGCKSGRRCGCPGKQRMGFFGAVADDTFTDANGCIVDTDGNLLSCPGGKDPNFAIGTAVADLTGAPQLPTGVSVTQSDGTTSLLNSVTSAIKQVFSPAVQPVISTPGISTSVIPGIPNSVLGIGAAILLVGSLAGRRRR